MTYLIIWLVSGIIGSIMLALGGSVDGEKIDSVDVLFLGFLSLGGIGTFLLGIPMLSVWVRSKFK